MKQNQTLIRLSETPSTLKRRRRPRFIVPDGASRRTKEAFERLLRGNMFNEFVPPFSCLLYSDGYLDEQDAESRAAKQVYLEATAKINEDPDLDPDMLDGIIRSTIGQVEMNKGISKNQKYFRDHVKAIEPNDEVLPVRNDGLCLLTSTAICEGASSGIPATVENVAEKTYRIILETASVLQAASEKDTPISNLAKATAERLMNNPADYADNDEVLMHGLSVSQNRPLRFYVQSAADIVYTPAQSASILSLTAPVAPCKSEFRYTSRHEGNHHFCAVVKKQTQPQKQRKSSRLSRRSIGTFDFLRMDSDDEDDDLPNSMNPGMHPEAPPEATNSPKLPDDDTDAKPSTELVVQSPPILAEGNALSSLSGASLSGASLSGSSLSGSSLSGASSSGVSSSGVSSSGASSSGVSLSGVSSSGASLSGASLSRASSSGVPLSGVPLSGVPLSGVSLSGVSSSGASSSGASLSGVSLSGGSSSGAGAAEVLPPSEVV